ncbi:MAG TPA: MFS transporter, partial [Aggregatilineaceae bacterium]|nr:MFS transporter [Aggregatilineaceae bacterium]
QQRSIALTEANIASSIVASTSPLLIAFYTGIGAGWRGAQLTILLLWTITIGLKHRQPIPDSPAPRIEQAAVESYRALPRIFWFYLLIVFLLIAAERCLEFWGADFMKNEVGLSKAQASSAIWAFMIGMLIGRLTVSRFAQRTPTPRVLLISTGVALVGFPIFWLSSIPVLTLIGLFVTGLGVSNFFPLSMSLAISAAPDRANIASVPALFGSGSATLLAPQVLGWIADQTTIGTAFGLVFVILLLGMGAMIFANRLGSRHNDALVL